MASAGRSRAGRRSAQTRERLIQAVIELMATTAPDAVTIQAVTEQADVGFGTFYLHFDGKDAIFVAALETLAMRVNQRISVVASHLEDPADAFATVVRMIVVAARGQGPQVVLWRRYQMDLEAGGVMSTSGAEAALRAGMMVGRFTIDDVTLTAAAVGSVVTAATGAVVGTSVREAGATASHTATMVLRMLGVPADEATRLARRRLRAREHL